MINKVAKFKDRFIKAMSVRDMRAVDITAQTGIPQATISQYKTGYAQPKSDKLQKIADALDMKNNSGSHLRSLNQRITKIMRDLIKAGYPVTEYRIKCCSWTEKETWHACFKLED